MNTTSLVKEYAWFIRTGRQELTDARFNGKEIQDQDVFAVGLELFHYNNMDSFLGLDQETIERRETFTDHNGKYPHSH